MALFKNQGPLTRTCGVLSPRSIHTDPTRASGRTPLAARQICRVKSACMFWLRVKCWCSVACLCWFAFQCAVTVGATVLALEKRPISAFLRPLDIYIYAFGSQPCATRLVFEGSARQGPDRDRAWHLWSSSSRSVAPRPRSHSPRRLSRRLHGVTRHNASSAEYRLLALRRVPPRIRRTEPSRVAQLATRHAAPLPHYMLNPFKPPQQPLTDATCSKVEIFVLRRFDPSVETRKKSFLVASHVS